MITRTPVGEVTFDEFVALVQDGQKADLINGVIYMASPESVDHNDLVSWCDTIIRGFLEERGLGKVTVNRVAYRLTAHNAPEPDVAIVLQDRMGIVRPGHMAGAPHLAIEIVSPDSMHRDYEDKRRLYEAFAFGEYWIIDPLEQSATFLVRGEGGFQEAFAANHIFRSRIVPGFWIDVRWLWQRPLPRTRPIVDALLADH